MDVDRTIALNHMYSGQELDRFPILGDGHQAIRKDLYTHCKDFDYEMDDQTHIQYIMFWP